MNENIAQVIIAKPNLPALLQARDGLELARIFDVDSPESAEAAGLCYSECRDQFKALDEERLKMKRPIMDAGKAVDDFFRSALSHLEQASDIWNNKITAYLAIEERLQKERGQQAREAARIEQERLTKLAREQEAKAEAEAARMRTEATALAAKGKVNAAQDLLEQASNVEVIGHQAAQETLELTRSVVPVFEEAPAPVSVNQRTTYKIELADLAALVESVAGGRRLNPGGKYAGEDRRKQRRSPQVYVKAEEDILNRTARAQGMAMQCPGVTVIEVKSIAKARGK